ncbi:MAG TPA: hypothetical protein VM031_05420 [Phycisphaerae bacterium]|nr:hypothetical protein [Phycisphaerae bacterium]
MLKKFLGLDDAGAISRLEWYLRLDWPSVVLLAAIVAAVVYTAILYRRERALRPGKRVLLGLFRATALIVLLVLLFEPVLAVSTTVKLPRTVLVLLDVSDSMNIQDKRRRPADQKAAALALGRISYSDPNAEVPEDARTVVSSVSRTDLARALLLRPTDNAFRKIAENYRVRYFAFGDKLVPAAGKGATGPEALTKTDANDATTRLGGAIEEALARFSGQSISGAVLLTDGASNTGLAPLEVARRMKERAIPLYPVGLGLARPADVRLDAVIVPETVFVHDKVPVRIQYSSTGFANRRANVVLKFEGREVAAESVKLNDRAQFLELLFQPVRKAEAAKMEVSIQVAGAEDASEENSRAVRTLRVIDDKIKVLYVEGKPRWEYRYLRRVLLRDHRLDVKFYMTEGDKELAQYSDRYLATFPMAAERAFVFDLVILGDVPAKRFSGLQMERMEELVRQRGGSFLLLAGAHHAPYEYVGTPIEKMLPVTIRPDGPRTVDDMVHPRITADGMQSAVASLEYPEERNQALWYRVRPLFSVPRLDGMKKGAMPLLTLSSSMRGREPYPLICWHRHRRGKVMFIGTDQLWRLRFKRGDKYHARFWGQTIQFLTLSRLLGGNKRIRIETDRTDYRVGQRVQISANVLDEAFSPVLAQSFDVVAESGGAKMERTRLSLASVPGMPGLFRGFFSPETAGRFWLRPSDASPGSSNEAHFNVEATSLERQQPAMQEELLRQMVELSGGRYFTVSDLPELPKELGGEQRRTSVRVSRDLFDLPAVFLVLLAFLGVEWFLRRRLDLV